MKPRLVLGLGNELAGDDGIGMRVARRLRDHPGLPEDVEVRLAGSDLLRSHTALRNREAVTLVDAVLGSEPPGTVLRLDPDDPALGDAGASVHQLSPTAVLTLLRAVDPAIRDTPVELIGIVIDSAGPAEELSVGLADRLDAITGQVVAALR